MSSSSSSFHLYHDRNKVASSNISPTPPAVVIKEGFVRRKREDRPGYEDRCYLHLHGSVLSFSTPHRAANEARTYQLLSTCKVSPILTSTLSSKKIYCFEITWPHSALNQPNESLTTEPLPSSDATKTAPLVADSASKAKEVSLASDVGLRVAAVALGGVVLGSLTAGVGLLAGLVVVGIGAAAGGGAVALNEINTSMEKKPEVLGIACDGIEDAKAWLTAIKNEIDSLILHRNTADVASAKPPSSVDIFEIESWINSTKWESHAFHDGFKIYSLPPDRTTSTKKTSFLSQFSLAPKYSPFPCQKLSIPINASPIQVYEIIREFPASCCTGIIKSLRVIEVIDRFTDVIYLELSEVFLSPTMTAPRDFCLVRYAKQNIDGSFVICLDSTSHEDCPIPSDESDDHIRAELHAVYVISPPRHADLETDGSMFFMESLLTFIAQLDPRGWIWKAYGYQDLFLTKLMLHLVDIRDVIDEERFVQISLENAACSYTSSGTNNSVEKKEEEKENIATTPPPTLNLAMWKEPDASTFRLRSKTYNVDKFKCNSAPSLFKLVAIDVFEVPECIQNISAHPRNRVYQSLQRNDPDWVFVVNIMVPGPPFYNFVAYMTGDKKLLEEDTPFGRIAKPFFLGNDDEFRRNRFKLIPKIIEGNMVIKMAVKDTPTLLGNKIKNYYYRGENYFELDVDAGSSSVARNVIGLAIGYAKSIVVDMAFCLQGNEEDELPEVIMGCCRCINVDMTLAAKLED